MPAQSKQRSFMSVICCTSDDIVGTLSAHRMRNRADRRGAAPLLVVRRCGLAACSPRSTAPVSADSRDELSRHCLDEMNHSSPRRLARTPIQPARSRRRRMRAASRAYQRLTRHESQAAKCCCGSADWTAPLRCCQQLAAVKLATPSCRAPCRSWGERRRDS